MGHFFRRDRLLASPVDTWLKSNGLINRELSVDFCFRLDMKGAGDLFLSAADGDDM
jgi:hypothetical protein